LACDAAFLIERLRGALFLAAIFFGRAARLVGLRFADARLAGNFLADFFGPLAFRDFPAFFFFAMW
jgi:hypothetical protein